jgi:fatty-acid peroxygenase
MQMPWRDRTLSLALKGYPFGLELTAGQQAAETVLLLRRAVVALGPEAARAFYASGAFRRRGAMPLRAKMTLTGAGAIQGLDGDRHRQRKALFLLLLDEDGVRRFMDIFISDWTEARHQWREAGRVTLHDEVPEVLAKAACRWVGVPKQVLDSDNATEMLQDLYESPARVGHGHWQGLASRARLERRLASVIRDIRGREITVDPSSPLHAWAMYREGGYWLPARVAAVETLNLLRPIVAIERYVLFVAHALVSHPQWRERLGHEDPTDVLHFVDEVRRLYPFFPGVLGKATSPTTLAGVAVDEGERVMLDLYGSNNDPNTWESPDVFDPDRFARQPVDQFNLIPQGGGDAAATHRCAGEALTIAVMGYVAMDLAADPSWQAVDERDMVIQLNEIPPMPKAGMVLGIN